MKKYQIVSIFIIIALSLIAAGSVFGQEPVPTPSADEVNSIAENMFCPVCENIPLDVCGTEACEMWREEIADLLMLGFSDDEIYEYFYERHGDMVLATPPLKGFNWLMYIIPAVALIVGTVFLFRYLKNTTKQTAAEEIEEKPDEIEDTYLDKLEEELKKRN